MRTHNLNPRVGWRELVLLLIPLITVFILPDSWLYGPLRTLPALHQIPAVPGGTALRIVMIHDVLMERYPRHGEAWHTARLAKRVAQITEAESAGSPASAEYYGWFDDAAVSCDQLHQFAHGEALMRRKLALLGVEHPDVAAAAPVLADLFGDHDELRLARMASPLPEALRPRYTASANLATLLVHSSIAAARSGDVQALARLDEGRDWLCDAIAIHPGAHFGRELWQLAVIDWVKQTIANSQVMLQVDMIGDSLDAGLIDRAVSKRIFGYSTLHGKAHDQEPASVWEEQLTLLMRAQARKGMRLVGAEVEGTPGPNHPVPFDEPALALLGMWMYGGGPNPHSALALAGIAERIHQPYLAWEGYARALELSERFHPDPAIREALITHCRTRQDLVLQKLQVENPQDTRAELQRRFDAERAFGSGWQAAYQADEAQHLATGRDCDDHSMDAAFLTSHPGIATEPGAEEWTKRRTIRGEQRMILMLPALVLGLVMVVACSWRRHRCLAQA